MSTLIKTVVINKEIDKTNPIPHNIRFAGSPSCKLSAEKIIPTNDNKMPISTSELYNNPNLSNPKYKLSL